MEATSAALFISISLVVFGICYYYFTTRHKERMTIIDRGLPPDFFQGSSNYRPLLLTAAIISIFISIGILFGYYISSRQILDPLYAIPLSLFLFLGIGLLVSYFLLKMLYRKN